MRISRPVLGEREGAIPSALLDFSAYGFTDAYLGTAINPTGGYAAFVDDSNPPVQDDVNDIGVVRWYAEGLNGCPSSGGRGSAGQNGVLDGEGNEWGGVEGGGHSSPESTADGLILIVGPEARSSQLSQWGAVAEYSGFPWVAVTLEEIRATWGTPDNIAIRSEIRSRFQEKDLLHSYVLFVGGWSRDPDHHSVREITPWYVEVGELSGADGLAATDQLYGDLDGDDFWDIPVWRIVPRDDTENSILQTKAVWYQDMGSGQGWTEHVAVHCDNTPWEGLAAPWLAEELSQAILSSIGPNFDGELVLASDYGWEEEHEILPQALNDGKSVIVAGPSTRSNSPYWLVFSPEGFRFNSAPPSARQPLMIGCSCYLGAFDIYNNTELLWDYPPPLCRDWFHIDSWAKGPISWIGPTRGSYQYVNYWIGQRILSLLTEYGHSFGQALLLATRDLNYWKPQLTEIIQTYTGLGIPWLSLVESPPYTGVREESSQLAVLSVSPNPVQSGQLVSIAIPNRMQQTSASICVYDVAGRLVRRVSTASAGRSPTSVHWNLKDADGRGVPAGFYLIRYRADELTVSTPILVVH